MGNISDTICGENQNTHFVSNNFFPKNRTVYDKKKKTVESDRPRRRWEDNIRMDLQEVGGSCGDWIELVQDRDRWRALVSTVRNLRVPKMRGIS